MGLRTLKVLCDPTYRSTKEKSFITALQQLTNGSAPFEVDIGIFRNCSNVSIVPS